MQIWDVKRCTYDPTSMLELYSNSKGYGVKNLTLYVVRSYSNLIECRVPD